MKEKLIIVTAGLPIINDVSLIVSGTSIFKNEVWTKVTKITCG